MPYYKRTYPSAFPSSDYCPDWTINPDIVQLWESEALFSAPRTRTASRVVPSSGGVEFPIPPGDPLDQPMNDSTPPVAGQWDWDNLVVPEGYGEVTCQTSPFVFTDNLLRGLGSSHFWNKDTIPPGSAGPPYFRYTNGKEMIKTTDRAFYHRLIGNQDSSLSLRYELPKLSDVNQVRIYYSYPFIQDSLRMFPNQFVPLPETQFDRPGGTPRVRLRDENNNILFDIDLFARCSDATNSLVVVGSFDTISNVKYIELHCYRIPGENRGYINGLVEFEAFGPTPPEETEAPVTSNLPQFALTPGPLKKHDGGRYLGGYSYSTRASMTHENYGNYSLPNSSIIESITVSRANGLEGTVDANQVSFVNDIFGDNASTPLRSCPDDGGNDYTLLIDIEFVNPFKFQSFLCHRNNAPSTIWSTVAEQSYLATMLPTDPPPSYPPASGLPPEGNFSPLNFVLLNEDNGVMFDFVRDMQYEPSPANHESSLGQSFNLFGVDQEGWPFATITRHGHIQRILEDGNVVESFTNAESLDFSYGTCKRIWLYIKPSGMQNFNIIRIAESTS